MRKLRKANGSHKVTEDSYLRCRFGLHPTHTGKKKIERPFVTYEVECYDNGLLPGIKYLMCSDCAKGQLKGLNRKYNHVVSNEVGRVLKDAVS